MIRAALVMLAKDLRLFVRDRVALLLAVLLPIVLVAVFGTVMTNIGGQGGGGMPDVEIALLDLDGSEASADFVAALSAMDGIDRQAVADDATEESLREAIHDGDYPFAIVVPAGFDEGADLVLLRDPGRGLSQQLLMISVVRALFEARGQDLAWDLQHRALTAAGIPEEWMGRVQAFTLPFRLAMETMFAEAEDEGLLKPLDGAEEDDEPGVDFNAMLVQMLPVDAVDVAPAGRDQQITYMVSHAVSGMTVMMLMFSLVGYARSLLEERDQGTLRRLLTAPVDPRAILVSKFLGAVFVGVVLTGILFVQAWLMFDLDVWARWDSVLAISIATAVSTTGFALLIATLARTDKQADGMSTIIILVMSALGGAWMPLMLMPSLLRQIAKFTLPYWSIDAFQATFWYGQHWTEPGVLRSMGVLMALGLVLSGLAALAFRRRYQQTT